MLERWPLPVAHRKSFAACSDGHRVPLRVQFIAVQVVASIDKLPVALRADAGQQGVQATPPVAGGIEDVQISPRVIHQALPITGHVTRIKVIMVGMAAYILALRRTRVHIAYALVI